MITTYLKSKNQSALQELCDSFVRAVRPVQGIPAEPETTNESGTITPAQPAKGDTSMFYVSILAPFPVSPYGEIVACDAQEGDSVCGVWA